MSVMSSRLNGFKDTVFDVAVVGGGIYGTTLAWEAARQGLQVALIEQKDFGHATSASSLKIMHGGLRYLQQLDFVRMRHSIVARRRGFIVAPNLVRPARFMVPTVAFGLQHKLLMTAAFLMNDTISFDRNRGVPEGHEIGMGRVWGYERVRELLAGVADMRVTGGAVWQDGFVENTERFTYAFAHTAETLGAVIANYTKATGLIHDQGHVQGVAIRDEDSGDESEIRARVVINAAGPWLPDLLPPGAEAFHRKTWAWTRGYNIIVRRNLFGEFGVGLEGRADDYDSESVVRRAKRNF
ncbi:MAG: FAD-dependent oxidoreductase, partial [Spartobacteria bacterium]|nr:FAD-dependent oxidoreductase [Spartobacteria bacterium]